jgi:hypothetical protein
MDEEYLARMRAENEEAMRRHYRELYQSVDAFRQRTGLPPSKRVRRLS